MKKALSIFAIGILFLGCNPNPNKEDRIQKLESQIIASEEKTKLLEERIETLENLNQQLTSKIKELDAK